MTPQHLAFPAASHANDVIAVDGSPGGDRRGLFVDWFRHRSAELTERLMNNRDQGRKLIDGDLITPHIGCDDFCRQLHVVLLVGHFTSPIRRKPTIPGRFRAGNEDSPYARRSNHPFVVPPVLAEDPHPSNRTEFARGGIGASPNKKFSGLFLCVIAPSIR